MKHGKKPTVNQCRFLQSKGINCENWFVVKDTPKEMILIHRLFDNKIRRVSKSSE